MAITKKLASRTNCFSTNSAIFNISKYLCSLRKNYTFPQLTRPYSSMLALNRIIFWMQCDTWWPIYGLKRTFIASLCRVCDNKDVKVNKEDELEEEDMDDGEVKVELIKTKTLKDISDDENDNDENRQVKLLVQNFTSRQCLVKSQLILCFFQLQWHPF